jgi:hypothetical protein
METAKWAVTVGHVQGPQSLGAGREREELVITICRTAETWHALKIVA